MPVIKAHYYHPDQQGSWSIKAVLPTIAPELDYSTLAGVQNGTMAMEAFAKCLLSETTKSEKAAIHQELTAYCHLDTLAMVHLYAFLGGEISKK